MAKTVKNVTNDSVTIVNGIRAEGSPEYKQAVPMATAENMGEVGRAILEYTPAMNHFVTTLINRVGLVIFKNESYTNALKRFKKGTLEYGETIEEIFVGIAKSYDYAWNSGEAEENPFKREVPDVKTFFHTLNVQKVFKQTSTEAELNLAFTAQNGIAEMVQKIIEGIFTSYEIFEWEQTKKELGTAYTANEVVKVQVQDPMLSKENMESFIEKTRSTSRHLTMPENNWNNKKVIRTTPVDKQVIFITPELEARMDVQTLAGAFNMDKTQFIGSVVVIDKFPAGMEDVIAVQCDERWFMIYDKLLRMESIYNPAQMYWNYYLHVWQVYSHSLVENCIAYTKAA